MQVADDGKQMTAATGVYRVVDVAALLDDDSETPPLVEGLLYPGMMTLVGSWVGKGKTTLAMGVIAALLKQSDAFDTLAVGPIHGPVVYFSEIARQSLRRLLLRTREAEGLDPEDFTQQERVRFVDIRGSILDPDTRREFAAATEGAAVVIIDTFDVWYGGRPNNTEGTLRAWGVLKEAAQRGSAILVLDHQAKPKAGYDAGHSAVGGNAAKQREPDIVFRLDRPEGGDDCRILQPVKDRHGDAVTLKLRYVEDRYTGEVTQRPEVAPVAADAPRVAAGRFIGLYLQEHGASRRQDIVSAGVAAGHDVTTIDRALRVAVSTKTIRKAGYGEYEPVTKDEGAADSGPASSLSL